VWHVEIALDDSASSIAFKVPVKLRSEVVAIIPPLPQAELEAIDPANYRFGAFKTRK